MNVFRSHLFPHITFVTILALICLFGLTRLRKQHRLAVQNQNRMKNAWRVMRVCDQLLLHLNRADSLLVTGDFDDAEVKDTFRTNSELVIVGMRQNQPHFEALDTAHAQRLMFFRNQLIDLIGQDPIPEPVKDKAVTNLFDPLAAELENTREDANNDVDRLSKTVFETANRFSRDAMITFILLVVVSVSYLYAVNWLLARPVRNLAAVAREVTRGHLRSRAKTDFDGPVSQLANDFNDMVDILVNSLAEEERVVRQLRIRTRELQAANEHKSRFLANVSHELKTPLNAVIGLADILLAGQHGDLSDQQKDYLERIFKAGNHQLNMISDLIDLAKLDLDALSLKEESFDAAEVVDETTKLLAPQADQKQIDLDFTAADDCTILADPRRLKQILLNLLSNAVKFTPSEGRVEVNLRTTTDELVLEVRDTGIGISQENQKRVFDDFVQLDSDLHRQHEGTGIGLTLTRRLVKLMGGRLSLKSELHKGSTFTVHLPQNRDPQTDSPKSKQTTTRKDQEDDTPLKT